MLWRYRSWMAGMKSSREPTDLSGVAPDITTKLKSSMPVRYLETPKGSDERRQLFQHAYSDVIGNIIESYNPGGGETNYTDTVVDIVKSLLPPSRKHTAKIFDLGCGSGNLLMALAKDGYQRLWD